MVKEILVADMIESGGELLTLIEKNSLHPRAALWLYSSERNEWQYVVALPMFDLQGPLKTYGAIRTIVEEQPGILSRIPFNMITVVSTSDNLIRSLRKYYRSGRDKKVYRIKSTNVNGEYIDDAYIFKML